MSPIRLLAPLCGLLLVWSAPAALAQDTVAEGVTRNVEPPATTADQYPAPAKTPEAAGEQFYGLLSSIGVGNQQRLFALVLNRGRPVEQSGYSPRGLGSASRVQIEAISKNPEVSIQNILTLLALQKDEPQFEARVTGKDGEATVVEVAPAPAKKREVVTTPEDGGFRVDLKATYGRWNALSGDKLDVAWYELTGIASPALAGNAEFQRARGNKLRVSCQTNLKQAMLGALQYAQDYDEHFPPANKWVDVLMPYVKSEQVFRCPALPDDKPGALGYAFNQYLDKIGLARLDNVAQTVAIYETEDLERNAYGAGEERAYRHLGGSNIAFADGHIKWFPKDQEPPEAVRFKP